MHSALLRGAVSLDGVQLQASPVDLEVVRAIELMLSQRRPVALVIPQAGAVLVTLAAAYALSTMATVREGARLAAVTTRLGGRERYDQLRVGRVDLHTVLPRCTWLRRPAAVGSAGTAVRAATLLDSGAGAATDATAVAALPEHADVGCGHVSCLSVLPDAVALTGLTLTQLRGVLTDLEAIDLDGLERLLNEATGRDYVDPLAILCVTTNAFDPALRQLSRSGGQVLCLDQPALDALANDGSAQAPTKTQRPGPLTASPALLWSPEALYGFATGVLHVTEVGDLALDRALAAAYAALTGLFRAPGDSRQESDLRWAWTLLSALGTLPVSVARHDRYRPPGPWSSAPLGVAVERAEALAASHGESGWADYARAVRAVTHALATESKAAAVLQSASALQQHSDGSVLVVVPNRAAAAALTAAFAESTVDFDLGRVHAAGVRDLQAGRAPTSGVALTVLSGPLVRRHSGLLAIPGPGQVSLLASGPHQSLRAAEQAVSARAAFRALREQAQLDRLSTLDPGLVSDVPVVQVNRHAGLGPGLSTAVESEYGRWAPQARQTLADRVEAATGTVDLTEEQLAWTPFGSGVLGHLGDDNSRPDEPDAGVRTTGAVEISAVPVALLPLDGSAPLMLPLDPLSLVTRRDPVGVAHVAARALQPGDLVAVIDGLGRQSLFEVATRRLAELPGWQLPVTLAALWRDSAARAVQDGESYEQLRARLGTKVRAATVGTWVRGEVAGPDDPADVRRLAEATGDQALLAREQAVWSSLQAIRRAHRTLGRWLSVQMAQAAGQGLTDDALRGRAATGTADRDLGINVADLLDGVQVLQVLAVGPAQPFLTRQVGHLQPLPASALT